ncbi:MAG TPA: tetratricopeptide repeat protein [Kofleriaceae bacterium]|nr:tetratricopeptide repeat protein [Kofleriaceae bacterium]
MRGHSIGVESVDIITRVLRAEFPDLDGEKLRTAVEKAVARVASASLDTEGYRVVDLHLAKVEATEESEERSKILRDLSETLEQRGDAERGLVVRLSAFSELATQEDVFPLLRMARITERWSELPLDTMSALVDINHDDAAKQLQALADAWQHVGRPYYAADCLERVLVIEPANTKAFETLEAFYRSTSEWPVLIDLLGRRAIHVESDKERAEIFRDMAVIYDREMNDHSAALDAYREADRFEPGVPEVLEGLARLSVELGEPEEEALSAAERHARAVTDPKERAKALCRAAELAKLQNWDKAQQLYEQAAKADPENVAAVDGLATLLRDKGQLSESITLLVNAAERSKTERARWLLDAADYCVALGDTDWAKQLYRDVRGADPGNMKAGIALVELGWEDGGPMDPAELAPILDQLCRTTDDPSRLRGYLIQRSKLASQVGEMTNARNLLARAVEIDPEDVASRRDLAGMLFEAQQWVKARQIMETLLVDEDLLPPEVAVELHYRVARCAREVGDVAAAQQHVDVALVLQSDHRPSLLLRTELGQADPHQLVADQLALANTAPPEERATRFQAIGDHYIELGDRAAAREMYREAIQHRPGDHLLLTKFLELVADDGDWSYSLDVVHKLIGTEKDPKVRARYRHLAGMIARDELDDLEQATNLFSKAVDDDPHSFAAADELESLLDHSDDRQALAAFYYKRLDQMREREARPGERLRLWDHLGELCMELDQYDDAVVAFEVAASLDADNLDRKKRLADLYSTDPKHDAKAIHQHHAILRIEKRRLDSYKALKSLYERTRQTDRARAVGEALDILQAKADDVDALFESKAGGDGAAQARTVPLKPFTNEDWLELTRLDVDLQLSALFAVVAPPFAVERARMRPPLAVPSKEHDVPASIQKVLLKVADTFGISPRPPAYFEREQAAPCKMVMRLRDGILVPVLIFGRPAMDKAVSDHELTWNLARQLSDLRTERIARLLCPRAGELAQIIELAMGQNDASSHAAKWMTTSLHPVELEQARSIGARLRDRSIHPMTAAVTWLTATERAADRVGFVIAGELARCVRLIEQDTASSDATRAIELIWSTVTEEVLAVRQRLEGWAVLPPPLPQRGTEARRVQ